MTLVTLSHHLGLMWVAMEATTLASAPLLYFNHNARSLEATWKYLLIGSVGIALALFGSFFLAYASLKAGLESTLLFDQLVKDAPHLSPPWLHAAFVLLFVGYGTKMGLAPMHTWKPDAYGEAPGMVGTLLAGGVTSCAFLAILRVYQICRAGADAEFAREIMIFMGLLSMAVAAVFMVRQRDFKRMLAYSSVEHMGILVLGVGIGGLAVYGALAAPDQQRPDQGSAVPLGRQHPPGLRQQADGRRAGGPRARAALGGAVPGGFPGHHRLASVRPVRERVHHRERRGRQRTVPRRRAVPAPARRRLHRHGGHRPGRGPGEPRRSRRSRPAFTTASAPAARSSCSWRWCCSWACTSRLRWNRSCARPPRLWR